MIDLNAPSRRDPMPDRQPLDHVLSLHPYGGPDPDRIRRRERFNRFVPLALITSIALLALGSAAWVLS